MKTNLAALGIALVLAVVFAVRFEHHLPGIYELGSALAFAGAFALVMSRVAVSTKVGIENIPAIFERLKTTGKDRGFAVFIFTPPGKSTPDEAINLQFSMEGEKIGLDWVLLSPANVRDKVKFVELATQEGYKTVEREGNNVKYLRVEEGDLPALCVAVIRDLNASFLDNGLVLIRKGFTWP